MSESVGDEETDMVGGSERGGARGLLQEMCFEIYDELLLHYEE